jgi:molybdopterin-biosynthesis enzyme MoeA-like protein
MILDEIDVIAREVKELAATHDVVFTSGGVGPTPRARASCRAARSSGRRW